MKLALQHMALGGCRRGRGIWRGLWFSWGGARCGEAGEVQFLGFFCFLGRGGIGVVLVLVKFSFYFLELSAGL